MSNNISIFIGNKTKWNTSLYNKNCLTFNQFYEWGEFKQKQGWKILRLVEYDKNINTWMCQVFIKNILGIYFIWIPGGPVGDLNQFAKSIKVFFRKKYGLFFYLRINCSLGRTKNLLKENNWKKPLFKTTSEDSMLLNIGKEIKDIKKNFSKKWKYGLNRSLKNDLIIEINTKIDSKVIKDINLLYEEMAKNKSISVIFNFKDLKNIFNFFRNNMIYLLCYDKKNNLLAVRGAIIYNDKSWGVLAASNNFGRKLYASYLVELKLYEYFHKMKVSYYDSGGADDKNNPGVYFFKKGTGAKKILLIGEWEYSPFFLISVLCNSYLFIKKILIK